MNLPMSRRRVFEQVAHARCTNAGLWHDVFVPRLRTENADKELGPLLQRHLEQVAGLAIPDGYREAERARQSLLRSLRGPIVDGETCCFEATVQGRMIVGMGVQSVLESNVALLRTWGVPYIPGSALKGLASSAAHRRGGATWQRAAVGREAGVDAQALFGDHEHQGLVTFHDAWWMAGEAGGIPLSLDVMTVHHPNYYGKGEEAPLDWDEPTPLPFLTAHGMYFIALTGPRLWIDVAAKWLSIALEEDGVGAKTNAGYGRLSLRRIPSVVEKQRDAAQREIAQLGAQHRGASTARQHLEKLANARAAGVAMSHCIEAAKKLCSADKDFWRGWARSADRSEQERRWLREFELIPQQTAVAPAVAAAPVAVEASDAVAWRKRDEKNRAVVVVRTAQGVFERELRLVTIDDSALAAALETANEATPVRVRVVIQRKGKFDRLTPAP